MNAQTESATSIEIRMSAGLYADECDTQGIPFSREVSSQLTIKGAGYDRTVIDCGSKGRVLDIHLAILAESILSLDGLAIRNGYSTDSGGAVSVRGGAIFVKGCSFENSASLANGDPDIVHGGGAIYSVSASMFMVSNSTFVNCSAPNASGGAILVTGPGPTVNKTTAQHFDPHMGVLTTGTPAARSFNVSSSLFVGCKAAVAGGAVAVETVLTDIRAGMSPWNPVLFER
jgi:hypothetical protein